MKKLMIALAVVTAAACSQAAVWQWNVNGAAQNVFEGGTTVLGSRDVYYFASFVSAAAAADSADALLSSLRENPSMTISSQDKNFLGTDGLAGAKTYEDTSWTDLNSYMYMYTAILADGSDGSKWVLITDSYRSKGQVVGGESNPFDLGEYNGSAYVYSGLSTTFEDGGWYQVAESVPEPTSGLLLLLGVAGLALRRRRA